MIKKIVNKIGKVRTLMFIGTKPIEIKVEAHITTGIPQFIIVGLAGKAISEARERIKSSLKFTSFSFPAGKIVVNLSPAHIEKEGTQYDLPIALAILIANNQIKECDDYLAFGELSLDGELSLTVGILPCAVFCLEKKFTFICGTKNLPEANLINDTIKIFSAENLETVVQSINNNTFIITKKSNNSINIDINNPFENIYGHELAKKALIISASGKHNLIMIGPHGSGKSTLAHCLQKIMPPLSKEESLEVTSIYSISNMLNNKIINIPPFREPHFLSSSVSIIGGGTFPKPGEISLAHHGILFLDELTEWNPNIIESLRTPLEEKVVNISRAKQKITYPCDFIFISATNPCKCGNLFTGLCICKQKKYYKISPPILDRMDLKITVEKTDFFTKKNITQDPRIKIQQTLEIQKERGFFNGRATLPMLEKFFTNDLIELLQTLCAKNQLSTRTFAKCLAVSLTISDLNQSIPTKDTIVESFFFCKGFRESV